MPNICVFPPNASLKEISDCTRHGHINRAEAHAGEARGELIRFDAKGNQFIASGRAGLARARLQPYPHTDPHPGLSAEVIGAAAFGEQWACRLVENFGAEVRPLEHVTYDDSDVWFNSSRGKPVWAVLKSRREEIVERCERFLTRRPRSGKLPLSEIGKLRETVRELRQERVNAELILKEIWPEIFVQFTAVASDRRDARGRLIDRRDAGARFMGHLSATPPEELPAAIAYQTIRAYTRGA
ncbi:MAG: hypothetical protein ABR953_14375 [Candidatus Acidiferrales bacterium]|jgi:hypothetical protein